MKTDYPLHDLGFCCHYHIFWNIFLLSKFSLFLFPPNLVGKKRKKGRRGGRRVGGEGRERKKEYNFVPKLECLLSSLSFNNWGEFIPWCVPFKENKHLFIFKFTTSFVSTPCLYQNWSSGKWKDDGLTLTPEKFSWIHPLVSKDSLPGHLLIPVEIKEAAGLTP